MKPNWLEILLCPTDINLFHAIQSRIDHLQAYVRLYSLECISAVEVIVRLKDVSNLFF